jgi:hypothetical protein
MNKKINLKFETLENKRLMAVFLDSRIDDYFKTAFFEGDRYINRQEAIELFKLTSDDNVVDQNEYNDLKKLTTEVGMDLSVQSLSLSILKDPANKGKDLKVGSSSSELFRLIDKWFLGKDRPATSMGFYKKVEGNLFVNGPSSADVKQGMVGDCYLVAALASIADKNPSVIQSMFTDNGDETWTIQFIDRFGTNPMDYTFNYVTVDKFLPVSGSGSPIYASFGTTNTSVKNELWVALIEKAYAQWNETGKTQQGNTTNSYEAISGGWSHVVYAQIYPMGTTSGIGTTKFSTSESVLQNALKYNMPITIYRYMNAERTSAHAYYVSSYVNGKYNLRNPWGYAHLTQTFTEMKKDCYGYAIAPSQIIYTGIQITITPKSTTTTKNQPRTYYYVMG